METVFSPAKVHCKIHGGSRLVATVYTTVNGGLGLFAILAQIGPAYEVNFPCDFIEKKLVLSNTNGYKV